MEENHSEEVPVRYVAFRDILGFSSRILTDFERTLNAYQDFANLGSKLPVADVQVAIYSGAILITATSLHTVLSAAQNIWFFALANDLMIRGAVVRGRYWEQRRDNHLLVASDALVRAVKLERSAGVHAVQPKQELGIGGNGSATMSAKKIAPGAIVALKEALTNLYWYKGDLRSFLTSTLTNPALLSRLNWGDYKRNIISELVGFLEQRQDEHQADLLRLMTEVARVDDFSHLERLEGGKEKAAAARASIRALRKLTAAHEALFDEQKRMEERRRKAHEKLLRTAAVRTKLEDLTKEYFELLSSQELQQRGYRLEKIIRELFELFDLDPRASFKIIGEQIDGAFTFDATDYLFEGKWQQEPVGSADLDVLAGKLSRKLDNTLAAC
jgi:hypothetical protein